MAKTFTYEENGLSYTVRVYEQDGQIFADITVTSGFMNVNAVYTADDDFSGSSASLGGPLNMNGGGSRFEGEKIQWDDAIPLSQPGLGHQDSENSTFLSTGDTLTVSLNVDSIDDVDFVGIRATSTSTPEGSIKGVSGNPVEDEDDDDGGDEDEATFSKVFFVFDPDADILGGYAILAEEPEPNEFNQPALAEGVEPTFANYVARFEEIGGDPTQINAVIFYTGEDLEEAFRLEGPFEDTDAMLTAYDEAVQAAEVEDLMVAFVGDEDAFGDTEAVEEDAIEFV